MTSSEVAKSDLSGMTDEALKEAIGKTIKQLNLYTQESDERKRKKYDAAKKDFNLALERLNHLSPAEEFLDSLFFPRATRISRILN